MLAGAYIMGDRSVRSHKDFAVVEALVEPTGSPRNDSYGLAINVPADLSLSGGRLIDDQFAHVKGKLVVLPACQGAYMLPETATTVDGTQVKLRTFYDVELVEITFSPEQDRALNEKYCHAFDQRR